MSKCSFLFVNYIYLIYFTVFNLINHKLLQNFAHVNKNHVEPGTLFTFCLWWNTHIRHGNHHIDPEGANVWRKTNVLVRIPVVISSLLTIYLWIYPFLNLFLIIHSFSLLLFMQLALKTNSVAFIENTHPF